MDIMNSARQQKIVGWSVLFMALFVSTFGLGVLLFLIGFISTVMLAVYMAIDSHLKQLQPSKYHRLLDPNTRFNFMSNYRVGKLVTIPENNGHSGQNQAMDTFSGDQVVDDEISSIIKLFFRDYVYSWYSYISSNEEFPNEIKSMITIPVQIICKR